MDYLKTIIYHPVVCPICKSKDTYIRSKLYDGEDAIRYHMCKSCGKTFRSIEG